MIQAEIYTAVSEKLPKNFPFYNWVPKPLGIIFLVLLFIPIMTVSGAYTVNSSEMVGGLGIQSEHIAFISFSPLSAWRRSRRSSTRWYVCAAKK